MDEPQPDPEPQPPAQVEPLEVDPTVTPYAYVRPSPQNLVIQSSGGLIWLLVQHGAGDNQFPFRPIDAVHLGGLLIKGGLEETPDPQLREELRQAVLRDLTGGIIVAGPGFDQPN